MKYVRKLTPVQYYDVAGAESWLAHMARRGLHLKKFRPLYCTFEQGEPREVRYRLEPHLRRLDDDLPQGMLELYEEFGWEYVDETNRSILIFRTEDPGAPEPHSDPELQARGWQRLYKSARNSFVSNIVFLLVLTAFCGYLLLGTGLPVYAFLTTSLPILLLMEIWFLCHLFSDFRDVSALSALVRALKAGMPMEHRGSYPRKRPWAAAGFLIPAALLVLLVVGNYIYPLTGGGMKNLGEFDAFPLLSLAELEGEGFRPDSFVAGGVDYANFFRRERSVLCPNQWEVVQSGEGLSSGLWVRLEIHRYDPLLPFLTAPLARELLDDAMKLDEDIWWATPEGEDATWAVTEYPGLGLDYLAVARRAGSAFQIAAAAGNGRALVVQYTGRGDLAEHLEEIAGMLTDKGSV